MSEIVNITEAFPEEFNPDFSVLDYYDTESSIDMVVFAALSMGLNSEMNELQRIQKQKIQQFIKATMTEGFCNIGDYDYSDGILHIQNEYIIFDGSVFDLRDTNCLINEGQTLYFETWDETVDGNGFIYRYGDINGLKLENYIIDPRIGVETSHRVQKVWQLTTARNNSYRGMYLGKLGDYGKLTDVTIAMPITASKSAKLVSKIWPEENTTTPTLRILNIDGVTSYEDLLFVPLYIRAYTQGSDLAASIDINNLGAKNIVFPTLDASTMAQGKYNWTRENGIYSVAYDGTNFCILSFYPQMATTTQYGLTKLNDTVTSTSTVEAATANAVRVANTNALTAQDTANTLGEALQETLKLIYGRMTVVSVEEPVGQMPGGIWIQPKSVSTPEGERGVIIANMEVSETPPEDEEMLWGKID